MGEEGTAVTSVPVWVERRDGAFTASVLGAEKLAATAASRDAAVAALVADLGARQSRGELVVVTLPPPPQPTPHTPEEKEYLDEIVRDIYRARDEEKAREFPE